MTVESQILGLKLLRDKLVSAQEGLMSAPHSEDEAEAHGVALSKLDAQIAEMKKSIEIANSALREGGNDAFKFES